MRAPVVVFGGSRGWPDGLLIRDRLAELPMGALLVHGGAPGADMLADVQARESKRLHVARIDALWDSEYGRAAGHVRNDVMLELVKATKGWAEFFWDGASPGTEGAIKRARALKIRHHVWHADGEHTEWRPPQVHIQMHLDPAPVVRQVPVPVGGQCPNCGTWHR